MLVDNPPNIVFKGYADWAIDFFDDKIEKLTGCKKEEFHSRKLKWIDLVVEEDLPAMAKALLDARKGSKEYVREYRIRTRAGDIVWVQEGSRIICDGNGRIEYVTGAFVDVTERKRAEEALRESQEKFLKAFSASPDAISISTLADGCYIEVNEAFLEASGYTRQEVIGRTVGELDIWDNPEDRKTLVAMVRERSSVRNLEFKFRKSSGEVCTMLCSAEVIELGGQACLLVIGRDITERKRLEDQLRQGQKLRSIGVLAGGVAHDFNNLLQIIQGYAELLLKSKPQDHPDCRKLEGILHATRRGCELTHQMLTFSRNMEAQKRPIDLNRTVEQVANLLEHILPKKIEIGQHLSSGLKLIYANPIQIEQVIMNLVVNSKDAMPEGGKVIIETRNVTLDEKHCRTYPMARPGDHVLLSVSDTGCGMDRETLDRVFEPFYSTKGPGAGTGLGLAIVYGIVQSHDGHVICYSEPALGTTFKIFLPAVEAAKTPHKAEEQEGNQHGTEVILFVDDEELLHELVTEILTGVGYSVISATRAEDALRIFSQQKERIDLVILDLIMPGIDGARCIEELRKIDSNVKILVASGYGTDKSGNPLEELEANSFVTKPYEIKQLLRAVREALDCVNSEDR